MKARVIQVALVAGAAAGMGLAGVIPATAAVSSHRDSRSQDVTASTRLTGRQDSGGNGNWANDNFTRVATLTPDGVGTLANCGITTAPSFTVTLTGAGLAAPDGNGWNTTITGNHAVLSDGAVALKPAIAYTDGAWSGTGTAGNPYVSKLTLLTTTAWKAGDTLKVTVPSGDSVVLSAPTAGTVRGATYTVPACNAYTAALKDNGTFTTIPLAYTPNQGANPGLKLPARPVNGQMNGYGDFTTFYAATAPDARLVPRHVTGNAVSSSAWPQLFFPAGTTLIGVNEATWGYYYNATVKTTTTTCNTSRRHQRRCTSHTTVSHQKWADTYDNGAGQGVADGNITG